LLEFSEINFEKSGGHSFNHKLPVTWQGRSASALLEEMVPCSATAWTTTAAFLHANAVHRGKN
jgi:hypothetical protein